MIKSRDRILTTHVGSLPRDAELTDLLIRREAGEKVDPKQMAEAMDRSVGYVVNKQKEAGIDIGNDGEQQRVAFQTYMAQRMTGFAGESRRKAGKDFVEFPELVEMFGRRFPKRSKIQNAPQAVAEISYRDTAAIKDEIARVKRQVAAAGNAFL